MLSVRYNISTKFESLICTEFSYLYSDFKLTSMLSIILIQLAKLIIFKILLQRCRKLCTRKLGPYSRTLVLIYYTLVISLVKR